MEKTVEPEKWMVHYKGQISAPEDGAYRFLGDADDFVVVAINGKTVLVAEMPGTPMGVKWVAKEAAPGRFQAAGDWINLRAGEPVDIDIVTGESPGGQYRCMLSVQKRGGAPLPFQLTVSKRRPLAPGRGAASHKGPFTASHRTAAVQRIELGRQPQLPAPDFRISPVGNVADRHRRRSHLRGHSPELSPRLLQVEMLGKRNRVRKFLDQQDNSRLPRR